MRYHLCFFPMVGMVIGALVYGLFWLRGSLGAGRLAGCLWTAAIPLLVTGGFHVDGFMDTMDALHSYQEREKKLEILKDPHIGAFSVIMLLLFALVDLGALSELDQSQEYALLGMSFVLSRTLSGLAIVDFPSAKSDGMVAFFQSSAGRTAVRTALRIQLVIYVMITIWMGRQSLTAVLMILGMAACFGCYYWKAKKEFGGITGDTAGYFVCISESAAVLILAVMHWLV